MAGERRLWRGELSWQYVLFGNTGELENKSGIVAKYSLAEMLDMNLEKMLTFLKKYVCCLYYKPIYSPKGG